MHWRTRKGHWLTETAAGSSCLEPLSRDTHRARAAKGKAIACAPSYRLRQRRTATSAVASFSLSRSTWRARLGGKAKSSSASVVAESGHLALARTPMRFWAPIDHRRVHARRANSCGRPPWNFRHSGANAPSAKTATERWGHCSVAVPLGLEASRGLGPSPAIAALGRRAVTRRDSG